MISQSTASVGSSDWDSSLRDLLREVRDWFARYVFVLRESDLDVLALWAVHTWVCEETYTTPRLLIDSPVPGSGKTTLLEHLGRLCKNPVQMASVSSSAMLARLTANEIRTLLIDEADRALNPKKPGIEDLIAILNSGYKRGGTRPVLVSSKSDWVVEEMPTFSPVALAGNSPLIPEDTRSRCLVVRLMPDREGRVSESDWEVLDPIAQELSGKIQQVMETYKDRIRRSNPDLPSGCVNRLKERWKPLKRIAEVASADWAFRVDELILADLESAREAAESGDVQLSPNLQLAKDLFEIFQTEPEFSPTNHLVSRLIRHSPDQWSSDSFYGKDLTPQRLGRILSNAFGINSMRSNEPSRSRGYHKRQFLVIWNQLGISPLETDEPGRPGEPGAWEHENDFDTPQYGFRLSLHPEGAMVSERHLLYPSGVRVRVGEVVSDES